MAKLKVRDKEKLLAAGDDSQRYNDEVIFPGRCGLAGIICITMTRTSGFVQLLWIRKCELSGRRMPTRRS